MTTRQLPYFLALAAWVSILATFCSGQQSAPSNPVPVTCSVPAPLDAQTQQLARTIGVSTKLENLRTRERSCGTSTESRVEILLLRQEIMDSIVLASLDVDEVLAEIDDERAQISQSEEVLTRRRDQRVNLLSMANIVASGVSGIAGTAMQFSARTATAGNAVGVSGGVGGVVLSVLGLRQQGGAIALGIAPNMLAPLFGRKVETRSIYPDDVWAYLNAVPLSDPRIHTAPRDRLLQEWVSQKRIGPVDAAASQKRIDLLTSRIAEKKLLPLDLFQDRSAMLMDLRASVALMKRDLRDLVRAVFPPEH